MRDIDDGTAAFGKVIADGVVFEVGSDVHVCSCGVGRSEE